MSAGQIRFIDRAWIAAHVPGRSPALPFIAGLTLGVHDLDATTDWLTTSGVSFARFERGLRVPPSEACGAFIEFVGGNVHDSTGTARMDRFADAIKRIGAEHCILSSDLGQQGNPLPPDGFGAFIEALRARGFSDRDLDVMAKQNPARLLGLP